MRIATVATQPVRTAAPPPLVHIIYEPSHHGDEAFQPAATNGVQAHHWPFGNMPAVSGLTRGDVAMVVAYIPSIKNGHIHRVKPGVPGEVDVVHHIFGLAD